MFLLIVIVILIAATSILANIYGWIFSFQQNYGDLENYSNSNYSAISAIERWLLVTKYKNPKFVWSWWFLWTWHRWELSDLFSGDFGNLNKSNNWLYRVINSQCNNEWWKLKNNQVLIFQTYTYNDTSAYTWDQATSTNWISDNWTLDWTFYWDIDLTKWNVYRQVNGDNKIEWYTWFVTSSWTTMIDYWEINDKRDVEFNTTTKNPIARLSWDVLCTQSWCYTNQSIWDLITNNHYDKWLLFYIQDRLMDDNNNQIWEIEYTFTNDFNGNCQNYSIKGISIIWKYKQELLIKKPTFNYRNPNRKKFIFPHYN